MGKFNTSKRVKKVKNHEGAIAYTMSKELELYNLVATSMLEDKFYESKNDILKRLIKLIRNIDPEFICKLAIYVRHNMYLRSIPIVLMVELAKYKNTDKSFNRKYIGKTITRILNRADEITEILSYYQITNKRTGTKKLNKLSKQVQSGIAEAFNKFDEYQFAKYNRKTEIKLKDALFLTHPKAKDENQQMIFDKIVNDNLNTPYTWEVELSARGNIKDVWEDLINSKKLGYMAILRNLRNILNSGVSKKYLKSIAEFISNKKNVRKSKQLPFRFYSAYRELTEISNSSIFIESLEKAIASSINNVDFFKNENILIASDVSGSMFQPLSKKSKVQCYDIGLLLSMLLRNKLGSNITTGIFGDIWKVKNLPKNNILANVDYLKKIEGEVGYSTNGYKVIEWALKKHLKYDKILIFTDCQLWDSSYGSNHIKDYWKKYKKANPDSKMYIFNLAGYKTTPLKINESDVLMISGWSEKIFDMLNAIENGNKVLEEINKIALD